jgi:hypothetical protein
VVQIGAKLLRTDYLCERRERRQKTVNVAVRSQAPQSKGLVNVVNVVNVVSVNQ